MGILLCFAAFLAGMLLCLALSWPIAWALGAGLVLFSAVGLRRGYRLRELAGMAWGKMPKTMIVLRILFLIGLLTGLWRSS